MLAVLWLVSCVVGGGPDSTVAVAPAPAPEPADPGTGGGAEGPAPPIAVGDPCVSGGDPCPEGLECVEASPEAGDVGTCQIPCDACDFQGCYWCVDDAVPAYCIDVGCS